MASLNKAMIIGNVGKDPEIKYTQDGTAKASFSLATSESWKDKNTGEKKEITDWHNIVLWGKVAEICAQYVKKGSKVYIEGKSKTRKWQDKETGQDKYITEIIGDRMLLLSGKATTEEAPSQPEELPGEWPF